MSRHRDHSGARGLLRFVAAMLARQAAAAIGFALIIAWSGHFLF
ncbi:hypothetical protein [Natronorubrum sp. FCH18a]